MHMSLLYVLQLFYKGWQEDGCSGWSMADEGRLATKVTSDLEVLHSKGPLITPGTSVLFKVRLLLGTDFLNCRKAC